MPEKVFVEVATTVGVAQRIATLIADCERSAEDAPLPWLVRIEAQKQLLQQPTLRALVALTTRIVEERPELTGLVAPAVGALARINPDYSTFHARVIDPYGAGLVPHPDGLQQGNEAIHPTRNAHTDVA